MNNNNNWIRDWEFDDAMEVNLHDETSFLKVKETLTRIGISNSREKKLFQTAHILHKQGKYYIVHFKELFALDNKQNNLSEKDVARRNTIIHLLKEWGLLTIVSDAEKVEPRLSTSYLKVIHHKDKALWELVAKYSIGNK